MNRKRKENSELNSSAFLQKRKGSHIIGLKKSKFQEEEKNADRKLWYGIRYGSEKAFKELFLKYNTLLTKYGRSIVNHPYLVEDCIHDLFLYLWEKRASLTEVESVKYYLLVSFRRKIFRVLEEKEKGKKLLDGIKFEFPRYEDFFEKKFVTNLNEVDKERDLKLAVDDLPNRQKEVLQYRYIQGLPYSEITVKMGISYVSVRKLVSKAIKNLRKKLH